MAFASAKLASLLALMLGPLMPIHASPCKPPGRDARVPVSFLADSDLPSLTRWASESTCINYVFERELAERRLGHAVILTVLGGDVGTIFEILLHTMNLQVKGNGAKRSIMANGPETALSRAANDREKAGSERDRVFATIDTEITKVNDGRITVTRRGADAILANITMVSRAVRVMPESKGNKPAGYRLSAIKPGSLFARLGFANGDLVQAVNGNQLSSPEKAVEAYTKLRSARSLDVSLVRAGKPMTLQIQID